MHWTSAVTHCHWFFFQMHRVVPQKGQLPALNCGPVAMHSLQWCQQQLTFLSHTWFLPAHHILSSKLIQGYSGVNRTF